METLLALSSQRIYCQVDKCTAGSHRNGKPQKLVSCTSCTPSLSSTSTPPLPFSRCLALPQNLVKVACVMGLAASLVFNPVALAYETNTPFSKSQTQKMEMGLLNGKIRPCPSTLNPNCISTSSMNATYAMPMVIPPESSETATRKLISAIEATQRNPKITKMEDTPNGQFLQVEVDGLFGRDVMEFLVKNDVVTYRSLAEKVLYVYPFTTPIGDFGAQEKRIKAIEDELGWRVPNWDSAY